MRFREKMARNAPTIFLVIVVVMSILVVCTPPEVS